MTARASRRPQASTQKCGHDGATSAHGRCGRRLVLVGAQRSRFLRTGVASQEIRIVRVNCAYERSMEDPDELLEYYHPLVGWVEALRHAGAEHVGVVQRFHKDLVMQRRGVDYHFVADGAPPFPSSRFCGQRVLRATRRLKPTVAHVDGLIFPVLVGALRVALPNRTPVLVQDHGGTHAPLFRSWSRRTLFRLGLQAADGFLFTAIEQASPWQRAGILRPIQPVYEILEGSVDDESWPIPANVNHSLRGRPALLWVGRLDANKDPLTVLRGFELAARVLPEAFLTMVFGDDALLPAVASHVAAMPSLRDRVQLRGALDRGSLPSLYSKADLFVIGSHREGSGFALIEALSFGVTPVVTDIPSFRRLTDGGRIGALFEPGNAEALARELVRLGSLKSAARREAVRSYFEREVSWAAVGRRAMEIYREAADRRGRG